MYNPVPPFGQPTTRKKEPDMKSISQVFGNVNFPGKENRSDKYDKALAIATTNISNTIRTHPLTKAIPEIEKLILSKLIYIMLCNSYRSPSGAIYCTPGEKWLANQLGVCRETISDHIGWLNSMRLIRVIHRRPVGDQFQTNLYKISALLWSLIGEAIKKFSLFIKRVTQKSHTVTETIRKTISKDKTVETSIKKCDTTLETILKRMSEKMGYGE